MKKWAKLIIAFLVLFLTPSMVMAADYWTGNDYFNSNEGEYWGVNADNITKVMAPGRVYSLKDINNYSAHITNNPRDIGNKIEKAFFWINNSRLAYVKLFKVNGGQDISFLFDKSIYLYCAEFDENFVLITDGNWGTNGTRYTLNSKTAWIMVVFRQVSGDLTMGTGLELNISSKDILGGAQQYILFEPFQYDLKLNGGNYNNTNTSVRMERLGVEQITLPTPTRSGYTFGGWKTDSGKIYKGKLPNTYDSELFKDTVFTAVWNEILPQKITLNSNYFIMEQNSGEAKQLIATVSPNTSNNKRITFTSSNDKIASVDNDGVITAKQTGMATITATTANGLKAECKVYIMGFDISIPSYCTVNEEYQIAINIYNNGSSGMEGRKHVILDTEDEIEIIRKGDSKTKYNVLCETSEKYGSGYAANSLVDTMDTKIVYYRLRPRTEIKKAGDYEGNVTFTVHVL